MPGADAVVSWFGRWPSFHDAEILSVQLNRRGKSWIKLHAWNLSDKTYEQDGKQAFVREKDAVVTFEIDGIVDLELADFSNQNVLQRLVIEQREEVFRLTLAPCYGIGGYIEASRIQTRVAPGKPEQE
jgi:hypothetical protein